MNNNLKGFKITSHDEKINFGYHEFGKYGFIMSPKYDHNIIYLPNGTLDHSTTIKYSLLKLFGYDYREFYKTYVEKCRQSLEENSYYMEREEIAMASFIASLGTVMFLNTSNDYYKSGLLFVPENANSDELLSKKIKEVVDFLPEDDFMSMVISVPSLEDTLANGKIMSESDVNSYKKNKIFKKTK